MRKISLTIAVAAIIGIACNFCMGNEKLAWVCAGVTALSLGVLAFLMNDD